MNLLFLCSCHDAPSDGPPGRTSTLKLLSSNYYWPHMRKYSARYVDHWDTCSRITLVRHAPFGLPKPIMPHSRQWFSITMDLGTGSQEFNSCNAILVSQRRLYDSTVLKNKRMTTICQQYNEGQRECTDGNNISSSAR